MRPLTRADAIAVERELASRSLADFARMAWPLLEPRTPLLWGWALDAIAEHLEAVTRGEIRRLLINVPPGMMKSLMTGVIWPAWEWGPKKLPFMRVLATSHKQDLAVRDAMKMRRVIISKWYQERWPLTLVDDQNSKTKFENTTTGFREASAFTSMTGARGDRVILDDPHSVDQSLSPAELRSVETTFREALPTRVNNEDSAIVVIMQRLHERDVSGIILSEGLPYEHLCIPMRYEKGASKQTRFFKDPRTEEGELVMPERFSEATVAELEKTLGAYGAAGQLQQRPAPRGGGLFQRDWFKMLETRPKMKRLVRAWDLAATANAGAARTAGVLMGIDEDDRVVICDVAKAQLTPSGVVSLLKNTAAMDGRRVRGSLPKDPGQAGKAQVEYLVKELMGYPYTFSPETGDKETRATPLAAQAESGNVYLVRGNWNSDFIEECALFPAGKFADQVDAASRAFMELTKARTSIFSVL